VADGGGLENRFGVTRRGFESHALRQHRALAHRQRCVAGSIPMIDDVAKEYLHSDLRDARETVLWKLEGLGEYDVRRPLTGTGTNLLGLVKHLALWESRYLGAVFGRPFPEPLRRWDDAGSDDADLWATEHETRQEITDRPT
jgi:uncharacterized protein DUF664